MLCGLSIIFLLPLIPVLTTDEVVLTAGEGDLQYSDNGSSNKSGVSILRRTLLSSESSDLTTSSVRVWSRSELEEEGLA